MCRRILYLFSVMLLYNKITIHFRRLFAYLNVAGVSFEIDVILSPLISACVSQALSVYGGL